MRLDLLVTVDLILDLRDGAALFLGDLSALGALSLLVKDLGL